MLSHHHEGRRGTAAALALLFAALLASALLLVLGVGATQQRSRAAAAEAAPGPVVPPSSSTPPSPRSRYGRRTRRPRTPSPAHAAAADDDDDNLGGAALRLARLGARATRRHALRGGLPEACVAAAAPDGPVHAAAGAGCGTTDVPRAAAVVAAMRHAWGAYARHAWGHDELRPRAAAAAASAAAAAAGSKGEEEEEEAGGRYRDWTPGVRLAVTLVDSLDTLYLMGLRAEFEEAAAWVAEEGTGAAWAQPPPRGGGCEVDGYLSVFETTIRTVGGLLSAYCLSHRPALLRAAAAVADLLLPAFAQESTGIPPSLYSPCANASRAHAWAPGGGRAVLAEVGSVQLELRWLTWLTGDARYDRAGTRAFAAAFLAAGGDGGSGGAEERASGLYPLFLSPRTAEFVSSAYGVGTLGDSFYEYLLKQHVAAGGGGGGGGGPPRGYGVYGEMWEAAVTGVRRLLAGREGRYAFVGPRRGGVLARRTDHLSCFFPGAVMLGLGSRWGWPAESVASAADRSLLAWAEELLDTCMAMYDESPVGLAPEQVVFAQGTMRASEGSGGYRLRPETAESLFYAYRLTGKLKYREAGWRIFTAIERHCRVPEGGYTGVSATRQGGGGGSEKEEDDDDVMESFFTAETLKYLFLLFADPMVLPLDRYVFNTEAHPLPIATAPPPSRAAVWSLKEGLSD